MKCVKLPQFGMNMHQFWIYTLQIEHFRMHTDSLRIIKQY